MENSIYYNNLIKMSDAEFIEECHRIQARDKNEHTKSLLKDIGKAHDARMKLKGLVIEYS